MIQELIDEAIIPVGKRSRSGKWSPSSFGKCLRNQYWNRADEPHTEPIDKISYRRFKCGNLFEQFISDLIPTLQRQVLCETEDVKGYADLVDKDTVYDIKSKQSKSFWYDAKDIESGKNIKDMWVHQWLQLTFYAVFLKKPFIQLVFVSKDDLSIGEYRQEVEPYWHSKLDEELKELNKFWIAKELPPAKPRLFNGKECNFCNWRTLCKRIKKSASAVQPK